MYCQKGIEAVSAYKIKTEMIHNNVTKGIRHEKMDKKDMEEGFF